jgi:two-component system, NarL family, capsular synthesis sensor histidine kinase RcsC
MRRAFLAREANASASDSCVRSQQRLYFATLAVLVAIVALSASLLAALAIGKQLDLQRSAHNASDVSLLLHRDLSFLVRTELTMQFYGETQGLRDAPDELVQQARDTGVVVGRSPSLNIPFDIVVSPTTRAAWGSDLSKRLWRLALAADATLATRQAFASCRIGCC